jgi:hypothetical protein
MNQVIRDRGDAVGRFHFDPRSTATNPVLDDFYSVVDVVLADPKYGVARSPAGASGERDRDDLTAYHQLAPVASGIVDRLQRELVNGSASASGLGLGKGTAQNALRKPEA